MQYVKYLAEGSTSDQTLDTWLETPFQKWKILRIFIDFPLLFVFVVFFFFTLLGVINGQKIWAV